MLNNSLTAAIDLILNPTYGDAYLAMKVLSQGVGWNDNDAFVTLHITANKEFDLHVGLFFINFFGVFSTILCLKFNLCVFDIF